MPKAQYPADHKPAMRVPAGGSSCASCEYLKSGNYPMRSSKRDKVKNAVTGHINETRVPLLQIQKDGAGRSYLYKPHYGYSNSHGLVSLAPPSMFRASLVRAVLREIRSLLWRIREIRHRSLDRMGIVIDPHHQTTSLAERESASDCCSKDTQNLYRDRPLTTLIEAELFVRGWEAGAEWGGHNSRTELHEQS